MKNIYHIHQSSNSYWDSRWTDTDYYLCDSEDEYQQKLAEYTEKRKQIEKEFSRRTQRNLARVAHYSCSSARNRRCMPANTTTVMNGAARSSMLSVSAGVRGWREARITSTF